VAVALASGSPAPGHAALASATSTGARSASAASGAGGGARHKPRAPKRPAAPAASPTPSARQHPTRPRGQAPAKHAAARQPAAGQAPAKQAPAKQAPAKQAAAKQPAAKPAPAKARPAPAPKPYLVYDSVSPQTIPGDPVVATYADGPHPDSPSQVTAFSHVLWIDIDASDPNANALDIEPGCASPSQAAGWVYSRLTAHPHATAILYTMISDWPEVQADVSGLPSWMRSHIRWWIADPTGTPHVVPGSQATQWYWGPNYDISTALPGF